MNNPYRQSGRWSVNIIGRCVFGLMSLICTVAFGGFAVLLWRWGNNAAGWKNIILRELLIDGFAFASFFMLLVTISCWSRGSSRVDRLLAKQTPRAYFLILTFAITVCTIGLLRR